MTPAPPTDTELDNAARQLIQALLTIQYHQDLEDIDRATKNPITRRRLRTHLRWEYAHLGLTNTRFPDEQGSSRTPLRGSTNSRGAGGRNAKQLPATGKR